MADLDTLVQAYGQVHTSLLALADSLGDDDWSRATGCPGWDVKDQLTHVVALEAILAGDPYPEGHTLPPDLDHVRNEVGRFMEVPIDVRRSRSPRAIVDEAREVFARRAVQLAAIEDLSEVRPTFTGGDQPLYRSLPLRIFDAYSHEQDIRRATGRPGHESGPAADVSVARARKGLAHYLPERLGGEGTVVLRVTGPTEAVIAIDLVAGLLDEVPDVPTVMVELTFSQLMAAVGGRSDAPGPDDVVVGGDHALAGRVLAAAGVTP